MKIFLFWLKTTLIFKGEQTTTRTFSTEIILKNFMHDRVSF